jgi:hypothetical protein
MECTSLSPSSSRKYGIPDFWDGFEAELLGLQSGHGKNLM